MGSESDGRGQAKELLMPSARSAWGIDIGNRALKAIKLVRDGDRFRVDDFEIIEHEQILSQAGDNKESMLQTALAHFMERHETKSSVVGVSVSGQQSFARFIDRKSTRLNSSHRT